MGVVSSLAGTLAAEELNHPDGSYFAFTTPRSHAGTEGRTVEPCTHRHVPVCIVYSVVHSFTSVRAVDGTTGWRAPSTPHSHRRPAVLLARAAGWGSWFNAVSLPQLRTSHPKTPTAHSRAQNSARAHGPCDQETSIDAARHSLYAHSTGGRHSISPPPSLAATAECAAAPCPCGRPVAAPRLSVSCASRRRRDPPHGLPERSRNHVRKDFQGAGGHGHRGDYG